MKKVFLLVTLIAAVFAKSGYAQGNPSGNLLASYYDIKNALVSTDAGLASAKAGDFIKLVGEAKAPAELSAADQKVYAAAVPQLIADAKHIAESKDAERQRTYFAGLSTKVYQLAKAVKLTDEAVYYDYCPMKKSYWLSADASIKNPYFGKQMLTCGKISETLNK